jgi:hypothetical protein
MRKTQKRVLFSCRRSDGPQSAGGNSASNCCHVALRITDVRQRMLLLSIAVFLPLLFPDNTLTGATVAIRVPGGGLDEAADAEPCNETETGELACGEPVTVSPWLNVITATITSVIVFGLTKAFSWLRSPMVDSVEPPGSIHTLGFVGVIVTLLQALVCGRCCCMMKGSVGQAARAGAEALKKQAKDAVEDVNHVIEDGAEVAHSSMHINSSASLTVSRSDRFGSRRQLATTRTHQPAMKRKKTRVGLAVTVVAVRDLPNMDSSSSGCDPFFRVTVITQDERDAKKTLRTTARTATLDVGHVGRKKIAVKALKSSSTLLSLKASAADDNNQSGTAVDNVPPARPSLNVPGVDHADLDDLESPLPATLALDNLEVAEALMAAPEHEPVATMPEMSGRDALSRTAETREAGGNEVLVFEDHLEREEDDGDNGNKFIARWDKPLVQEQRKGLLQKVKARVCCCFSSAGGDNNQTVVPLGTSSEFKYAVDENQEEAEAALRRTDTAARTGGEQLQWDLMAYELVSQTWRCGHYCSDLHTSKHGTPLASASCL